MAFKKDLPTSFDVTASYWNIGEEHKDFKEGTNRVVFYGYSSNAARVKGSQPLSSAQVMISGQDFDPNMTRAQIYAHVKTKVDQFANSEDV